MTPFSIAGIQMHIAARGSNVAAMRDRIDIAMAHFGWVDMIMFSELAAFGPLIPNHPQSLSETLKTFQEAARKHAIWLIPGSMFEHRDGKVFNTSVVINPDGEIVGRYDKMFPFTPYETDVASGDQFLVFDVPDVGRFGLSICYDMWFPETTRTLTSMGAEVLLHPVLTGTTDRDVELAMARATAAQFQCYVVDINGMGAGGLGRSCFVGPGGNMLYEARGNEEIIPIEIDLDIVRRQRAQGLNGLGQVIKSFRDRVVEFDVYDDAAFDHSYQESLGPVQMPKRRQATRKAADVKPIDTGAAANGRHSAGR